MEKIDVCINVCGKPWQTICTLKSLLKNSGDKIDKIFLILENHNRFNDNLELILPEFDNLIVYKPKTWLFTKHYVENVNNKEERYNIRYQYGIENSDKKFLFITHNDVLYTGDIISEMLGLINDNLGIGEIGQCWNCPANNAGICNGSKFNEWTPTYEEIKKLKLPHVRTTIQNIDPKYPKLLPECRLNEWSCLINRELTMMDNEYEGKKYYFGLYDGVDLGTDWFKIMNIKGYKFINYTKNFIHGFWSNNCGNDSFHNFNKHLESEKMAKKYYEENFI